MEDGRQADAGRQAGGGQAVQKVVSLGGRQVVSEVGGLRLHLSKAASCS